MHLIHFAFLIIIILYLTLFTSLLIYLLITHHIFGLILMKKRRFLSHWSSMMSVSPISWFYQSLSLEKVTKSIIIFINYYGLITAFPSWLEKFRQPVIIGFIVVINKVTSSHNNQRLLNLRGEQRIQWGSGTVFWLNRENLIQMFNDSFSWI